MEVRIILKLIISSRRVRLPRGCSKHLAHLSQNCFPRSTITVCIVRQEQKFLETILHRYLKSNRYRPSSYQRCYLSFLEKAHKRSRCSKTRVENCTPHNSYLPWRCRYSRVNIHQWCVHCVCVCTYMQT